MRVLKTQIYRLFQIVDFKNANIKLLYSCTFFKGFLSVIFYKEQSFKPLTDLFKTWNKEREGYLAISLSYDLYPPQRVQANMYVQRQKDLDIRKVVEVNIAYLSRRKKRVWTPNKTTAKNSGHLLDLRFKSPYRFTMKTFFKRPYIVISMITTQIEKLTCRVKSFIVIVAFNSSNNFSRLFC